MNTMQFLALFFNLAVLLSMTNALGGIELITLNGALTVPLLAATAGSLATPLAVLGVLKLGAAALIGLSLLGGGEEEEYGYEEPSSGYGRFRRRHQRSAEEMTGLETSADAIFGLVAAMDTYGCGKQLICELEAKNAQELQADEKLMLTFFSKGNKFNAASPKAEFDLAAELGVASKNQLLCRARYAACPYTSDEMMAALRSAHL